MLARGLVTTKDMGTKVKLTGYVEGIVVYFLLFSFPALVWVLSYKWVSPYCYANAEAINNWRIRLLIRE
jgi:phosphate starvation-inducible membrane PsiE